MEANIQAQIQELVNQNQQLWQQVQQVQQANQNNQNAPNNQYVHRVAAKLPPFWSEKPALWFAQVEALFTIANINQETTRFAYVVGQLDSRFAAEVEDIIENPPADRPYTHLKNELIRRLCTTEEHHVRQLLNLEELGDRKPSQFFKHLRSLANVALVPDNLLKTLWLQRLPTHIQGILQTQADLPLVRLTELADKIIDVSPVLNSVSVNAINSSDSTVTSLSQAVKELSDQVSAINAKFSSPKRKFKRKVRFSRHSSPSSGSDSRPEEESTSELCWYHESFGEKALKCLPPCNYSTNFKGNH